VFLAVKPRENLLKEIICLYIMDQNSENNVKSKKPKDPLYFKKYYQANMKGVKHYCEICDKHVSKDGRAAHFKTQKHILNQKNLDSYMAFVAFTYYTAVNLNANILNV